MNLLFSLGYINYYGQFLRHRHIYILGSMNEILKYFSVNLLKQRKQFNIFLLR